MYLTQALTIASGHSTREKSDNLSPCFLSVVLSFTVQQVEACILLTLKHLLAVFLSSVCMQFDFLHQCYSVEWLLSHSMPVDDFSFKSVSHAFFHLAMLVFVEYFVPNIIDRKMLFSWEVLGDGDCVSTAPSLFDKMKSS